LAFCLDISCQAAAQRGYGRRQTDVGTRIIVAQQETQKQLARTIEKDFHIGIAMIDDSISRLSSKWMTG
jgi:hypothetical protein